MHNIRFASYPENCDKNAVKQDWDKVVQHEDYQEGAAGLPGQIRWLNAEPLANYDQAEEYLKQHDRGNYDNLAVRYYDTDTATSYNKKVIEARNKYVELFKKYNQLREKFHFENVKSAFIGCKNCGSKIAVSHLRSNYCPVCRHDMRPKTTQNAIESAKKAAEKSNEKLKKVELEEAEKLKSKANIKWLVKVEFHT